MLAGNVTATLAGGNLTLTGDNVDNDITVSGIAPNISVSGTGTTINGLASKGFSGVTGSITINLKGGNDRLTVDTVRNIKGLFVDTGGGDTAANGNDFVNVFGSTILGDVRILTGAGNDEVNLFNTSISKTLLIDTGSENDEVEAEFVSVGLDANIFTGIGNDEATANNDTFSGNFKIDTGSGDDEANLLNSTVAKDATILTGSGLDTVFLGTDPDDEVFTASSRLDIQGNLLVDTGADADNLTISDTTVHKDANIFTGSGADNVTIGVGMLPEVQIASVGTAANVNVYGNLLVDTGSEADYLSVDSLFVGKDAKILTGQGADHVTIGLSASVYLSCPAAVSWASVRVVGNLSVDTGSEGDWLNVASLYVGKDASFVTGGGGDFVSIGQVTAMLQDWGGWSYSRANIYVGGNLLIDTGGENDCLDLYSVYVGGNANIFLGGGADMGDLAYIYVEKTFKLDAGGENDNVKAYDLAALDAMYFYLGGGDDTLCLGGSSSKLLYLDGGSGYDKFLQDSSEPNTFTKKTVLGIEYYGECWFFHQA
jgi:hypothetical protein